MCDTHGGEEIPPSASVVAPRLPALVVPEALNLDTAVAAAVFILPRFLLRPFLPHFLNHLIRTVEYSASRGTARCAFWCLRKTFDGTRRVKVMATARDNRVGIRLATDEASKRNIFIRIRVV